MITSDTEAVADHVNQARDFLAKSREYLTQDDLHQASERGWGAAAHMAKAVAIAQGWEYERHSNFSHRRIHGCQMALEIRHQAPSDGQPSFMLFYLTALYGISG